VLEGEHPSQNKKKQRLDQRKEEDMKELPTGFKARWSSSHDTVAGVTKPFWGKKGRCENATGEIVEGSGEVGC